MSAAPTRSRLAYAIAASILLHIMLSFGELAWAWWQAWLHDEPIRIKDTQLTLQSQSLDSSSAQASGWPGEFRVQLGRQSAATQPAQRHATPNPHLASPDSEVPAAQIPASSETAAEPEDEPERLASAEKTASLANNSTTTAKPERLVLDPAFPRAVDIDYVAMGIVDAEHHWRADGKQYEITTRIKLEGRQLRSSGEIDRYGLKPRRFSDGPDQNAAPNNLASFNWKDKTVSVGPPGNGELLPLQDGAQDMFSAAYQFALQGRKLPSFTMQVVSARHSYLVPFAIKGEAALSLSGEDVPTLVLAGKHLQRSFEFFLAPAWNNLPVRIRIADGDRVIDLQARQIRIDGKLVLKRQQAPGRDR